MLVKPGDRIPIDGIITSGECTVDESMLTGESMPVEKKTDDGLYGGTVNLNGSLVMRVTRVGQETALAQIIAAVEHAQSSQAKAQRLADKISSIFVPIVVLHLRAKQFGET